MFKLLLHFAQIHELFESSGIHTTYSETLVFCWGFFSVLFPYYLMWVTFRIGEFLGYLLQQLSVISD